MEQRPFFFVTSGESHGQGINVVLLNIPAGIPVLEEDFATAFARRRMGYGRGKRMNIEKDNFTITGGLRGGKTTGNPFSIIIWNSERDKWKKIMDPFSGSSKNRVTKPRPGHADFAGLLKYGYHEIRDVIERASARETVGRVAAGVIAKKFLNIFNIRVLGFVESIGRVKAKYGTMNFERLELAINNSIMATPDREAEKKMINLIDNAKKEGDTIGGKIKVIVNNCPPGLGSYHQWYDRLDARLSMALMSIQGIKAVEIGAGTSYGTRLGSKIHDEIYPSIPKKGKKINSEGYPSWQRVKWFRRKTNNAGGIEGGVSNGEDIIVSATMKPIPTLLKPLKSIDIISRESTAAHYERSDVCVLPAASFVCEAMVSIVIAQAFLEKFGGDNIEDIKKAYSNYLERIH